MIDDCAAVEALLVRAAEGRPSLDPPDPEGSRGDDLRLKAHLDECPSCRAALADQRAMRELLQGYPVEGARLGFDTRVMAAIRAEAAGRAAGWLDNLDFRRWTWRLVPIAAALAIASVVVTRTDTTSGQAGDETTLSAGASTDMLPVSSALWSESVSESSLLSLMLTANADDPLSKHQKEQ